MLRTVPEKGSTCHKRKEGGKKGGRQDRGHRGVLAGERVDVVGGRARHMKSRESVLAGALESHDPWPP